MLPWEKTAELKRLLTEEKNADRFVVSGQDLLTLVFGADLRGVDNTLETIVERQEIPHWAKFVGGVVGMNQGEKTVRYKDLPV